MSNRFALVEELKKALEACEHPHAVQPWRAYTWCNLCGAMRNESGLWIRPHWRDLLVRWAGNFAGEVQFKPKDPTE